MLRRLRTLPPTGAGGGGGGMGVGKGGRAGMELNGKLVNKEIKVMVKSLF